jgi:arsenate reductase
MRARRNVLFVCGRNAGRSQMATAFFTQLADPEVVVGLSAGLDPAPRVHPEVVSAMLEVGIDLSGVRPTALTGRMQSEAFFLVTLGCSERCPMVPPLRRADWSLEDPEGQPIERVREIRDEVRALVLALVAEKGWRRPSDAHPAEGDQAPRGDSRPERREGEETS